MIGRLQEKARLLEAATSKYSEFVAVYGRRCVGKTFLVRETFNYTFTFQHSGLSKVNYALQLSEFWRSLKGQGLPDCPRPKDWFDAFDSLQTLLAKSTDKKKIVFLDELPWMDTPRSNFVSALEHFWNGWASARKDILLIICGSATSWIISKVLKNHGGLHNRVTLRLPIRPFSLRECRDLAEENGLRFTERDIAECYMIMGGIPFYWSRLQRGLSLAQNIDGLLFNPDGELHHEFHELFSSLFKMDGQHVAILECLGKHLNGLMRSEIMTETKMKSNGSLTQTLEELEECVPGTGDVEAEVERLEIQKKLNDFLLALPQVDRQVFMCRYWDMDSISDIARQFACSESKIKSMLYRTRKKLRAMLEKEGY